MQKDIKEKMRTIYFEGDLATARTKNPELDEAAKQHLRDYEAGKCLLVRKRLVLANTSISGSTQTVSKLEADGNANAFLLRNVSL
jgi:hypothetical protein